MLSNCGRNSTWKIFRKKNSNIKFEFLYTIVRKVTRMIFVILKNKKKLRWIHLNHSYISNASTGNPRHKKRYDADSQGFGQITIDIQFGFFLASLIMKKLTTFEYLAFVLFFSASFSALH